MQLRVAAARVNSQMEIRFPIVPVGTNNAASFSSRSAANVCSLLTVGSSPYTSSPTGASMIAMIISAVGFVTVSDRMSGIRTLRSF